MANYTKANDDEHEDSPLDWLSTSLIFAGALGNLLQKDEGIVVKIKGDMNRGLSWLVDDVKTVIVYSRDSQIHIMEADNDDLEEGRRIWLHFDLDDFSDFEPDL